MNEACRLLKLQCRPTLVKSIHYWYDNCSNMKQNTPPLVVLPGWFFSLTENLLLILIIGQRANLSNTSRL